MIRVSFETIEKAKRAASILEKMRGRGFTSGEAVAEALDRFLEVENKP